MSQGISKYVHPPTKTKRSNSLKMLFFNKNKKYKNDRPTYHKRMHRFGKRRIPDGVPERIMHPFLKTLIRKDFGKKCNHINQIGQCASHTDFPGPGFSIKKRVIPKKMFIDNHIYIQYCHDCESQTSGGIFYLL